VDGVAVSSSNDVYAAGEDYSSYMSPVVEFTNATGSGTNLGLTGLYGQLAGVIVAGDDLIVTDFDADEVVTYPLGQTSPSSAITVYCPEPPRSTKEKTRSMSRKHAPRIRSACTSIPAVHL
jgi:hypothetical protein